MRWLQSGIAAAGAIAALLTLTSILHSDARAQQEPGQTLQVYSRISVVDVIVTDAAGLPVQGLKQSDFTLLEDGKPQPIHNFDEVIEVGVPALPQLPPNIYTNLQPEPASAAINILLLDFANEAPVDTNNNAELRASLRIQHSVKDSAIQAIDKMPPGTRVMVLSMTNHLRILQSLTADKDMLKAAIDAAPYDLDGNGDVQCVQSDERNRMVIESLDQIAADVFALKRRKNLLWFTMGVPAITDPNERPKCLPDYTSALFHTYDLLNNSQVAIYPIDARGLSIRTDQSGALLSMDTIAEATGGVAYYNTNDITTAVLQALDNGANYYSIAYIPPGEKYDGKLHHVEVKVDRNGVNLVYRKSYYADDPSKITAKTALTMDLTPPPAPKGNMKAPMSRGFPTSEDILFDVGVQPSTAPAKPGDPPLLGTLDPKLQGKHLTRYGLSYVVPAQQIAFNNASGNLHKAALDFDIAVYDTNDKLLTGLSQIVKTTLSDKTYRQMLANKEPIRLFQQIDLPPGLLFLRVGVLDHTTNKYGTLELPLKVGKK